MGVVFFVTRFICWPVNFLVALTALFVERQVSCYLLPKRQVCSYSLLARFENSISVLLYLESSNFNWLISVFGSSGGCGRGRRHIYTHRLGHKYMCVCVFSYTPNFVCIG